MGAPIDQQVIRLDDRWNEVTLEGDATMWPRDGFLADLVVRSTTSAEATGVAVLIGFLAASGRRIIPVSDVLGIKKPRSHEVTVAGIQELADRGYIALSDGAE